MALEDSIKIKEKTWEIAHETQMKNIDRIAGFHNNLAILSGGAIIFSITYLGYLRSAGVIYANESWIIVLAWIYLVLVIITSLLRNSFHFSYIHYHVLSDYSKAYRRKEMDEMDFVIIEPSPSLFDDPIGNEDKFIRLKKENISTLSKSYNKTKGLEKNFYKMFLFLGTFSIILFVFGIISLLFFAIKTSANIF